MRTLKYLIFNAVILGLILASAVYGIEGAGRLVSVVATISLVGAIVSLKTNVERVKSGVKQSLPGWVFAVVETTVAGTVVWFGWWWTAFAVIVAASLLSIRYATQEDVKDLHL